MSKLLALDLSTTCTGFAIFDIDTQKLEAHGIMKPGTKKSKIGYPKEQLQKIQILSGHVRDFIFARPEISVIAIEEVNRGISRLGQKVLNGYHFILLDRLGEKINMVVFKDSDGRTGWRPALGLYLSEDDKKLNDFRRKANKKLVKGIKKYPVITKKHLACRFVNKMYGENFDVDARPTDSDICDAIGLGTAILRELR